MLIADAAMMQQLQTIKSSDCRSAEAGAESN
jgi:hypothetical protein